MRFLALLALLVGLGWAQTLGPADAAYFPGTPTCNAQIAINQNTSTDVKTLTNNGYICAILLVSQSAQSASITQGTGTLCATGATALIGATGTQSSTVGMPLAANSGFSLPLPAPIKTTATAQHLCLLQSGTGAGNVISGVITYIDTP